MRAGLGVEFHCCHFTFVLLLHNAMRELESISSGFGVPEVTAFRIVMANCVRSAEPGLRDEIRNSAARYRYGCTVGDSLLLLQLKPFLLR